MIRISIAMCTYNGAVHLHEQLQSFLDQDQLPYELQVGDDGSTDATLEILSTFAARAPFPVVVHSNGARLGFGRNFTETAQRCTGEWVAFSDQDDVWAPNKLRSCATAIEDGGEQLNLVLHAYTRFKHDCSEQMDVIEFRAGLIDRSTANIDYEPGGFQQVVRRSLFDRVPLDRHEMPWVGFPQAHDVRVWLTSYAVGEVHYLAEPLVRHRRHGLNVTHSAADDGQPVSNCSHARSNNRDHYFRVAEIRQKMSVMFSALAQESRDHSDKISLDKLADELRQQSRWLEQRGKLYSGISFTARIKVYAILLLQLAYRSGNPGLGMKSALKDAAFTLAPALTAPPVTR
jgi:glycosyltransferase involved in cell wall biosynthesis